MPYFFGTAESTKIANSDKLNAWRFPDGSARRRENEKKGVENGLNWFESGLKKLEMA